MIIQCTKSLLQKLGLKETDLVSSEGYEQFPESFTAWHANYVKLNGCNVLVLMNNETRFPVVICKPTKKELKDIDGLIRKGIAEALRMEGVREEVIEDYFNFAGEIVFSKTASRSIVGKMNNAIRDLEIFEDYIDKNSTIQRYISLITGRFITNEGFYPIEKVLECLGVIYAFGEMADGNGVLDIDLYQLKIQLDLEGYEIWRRVLVPSTFSFRHLHNIIQTVFDWQNYHLHEFTVKRKDMKPLIIVMDDDSETLDFVDPESSDFQQERFVALKDVFPKYKEVTYVYDFGDCWSHTITFEKVEKSKVFQAMFVEGKGERPPEDVGGLPGYENYLSIIEDESHPEYEEIKEWAKGQSERKLSPEQINKRLKLVISAGGYSTYVSNLW